MTTNLPLISLIVPTYNRAELLPRALQSVFDQTYRPAEIIVVDDGSEDNTAELIHGYDQIRYLYQPNAGASSARNLGVAHAANDWIAFLDSDDYWDEGFLERIANVMQENSEAADIYFSDIMYPPKPVASSLWEHIGFQFDGPSWCVVDGSDWVLMPLQPFRIHGSVFRKSKYLEKGGQLEALKVRNDYHLFLRLGLESPMCAVKGIALYVSMEADNRLTSVHRGRAWPEAFTITYRSLLETGTFSDETTNILRRRYAETLLKLAGWDWRHHHRGEAMVSALRSLRADPRALYADYGSGVKRRLDFAEDNDS